MNMRLTFQLCVCPRNESEASDPSAAVQEAEEAAAAETETADEEQMAPVMAVEEQSEPQRTLAQHEVRVMFIFLKSSHLPVVLKFCFGQTVTLPSQRQDSAQSAVLLVWLQY